MSAKRLSYYERVLRPRIERGLCKIVKCDGIEVSSGLCLRHYNEYYPGKIPNRIIKTPWAGVDWSLTNKEIAFLVNRSESAVCIARRKWSKPCPTCGCMNPRRAAPTPRNSKQQ